MPHRAVRKRKSASPTKRKATAKANSKPRARRSPTPKVTLLPKPSQERPPLNADPKAPRDKAVWSGLDVRRASAKGLGLFSTARWAKGQLIATVQGTPQAYGYDDEWAWGETWFGVAPGRWIEPFPNSPPAFVNHSCEPNAQVSGGTKIHAIRPIEPGEEITIDYALTEEDPHWAMACACGSARCVGTVRGSAAFAAQSQARRLAPPLAPRTR